MTNDELATAFQDLFTEAHAKVDALDAGSVKTTATRLLSMFHHAGEVFAAHAVDNTLIQPLDGTNKGP